MTIAFFTVVILKYIDEKEIVLLQSQQHCKTQSRLFLKWHKLGAPDTHNPNLDGVFIL